jgi:MarR family transcriptional regulator, organic hydroperoxide resistance regulator
VETTGRSTSPARTPLNPRSGRRLPAAGFVALTSLRHDGLALEVLGKFREIFRAAKLASPDTARAAGVTAAELWALAELHRHPGARVSDLTVLLSLRQSTVSNLVERLAQAKLVSRRRNDPDRRVVRLYLTRAGERLIGRAPAAARAVLPDALERLSTDELRHLDAQLARLLLAMTSRYPALARFNAPRPS